MKKKFKIICLAFLGIIPLFSFAVATPTSVADILKSVNCLALDFVPMIVLFAFIAFLTGLMKYISSGDNEEKRTEARKMMIYGILGFFFMVAIWGILGIFTNSFGLRLFIPQFKSDDRTSAQNTASCSR